MAVPIPKVPTYTLPPGTRGLVSKQPLILTGTAKLLGQGTFGYVFGFDSAQGPVAVKVSKKQLDAALDVSFAEMCVLAGLHHPNVVPLIDAFATPKEMGIILPLAGEALNRFIARENTTGGISLERVQLITLQLARGMAYIQSRNVLHGDYKPDNVLVYEEANCPLRVAISDFGLAKSGHCIQQSKPSTVFTIWWRAPELLLGGEYTTAADTWALGCIVAEMLTRKHPFMGDNEQDMLAQIFHRYGLPNEATWPGISLLPEWKPEDIKTYAMANNYGELTPVGRINRRFSIGNDKALLSERETNFLDTLLTLDPTKRPSAKQIAETHPWLEDARQRLAHVICQEEPKRITRPSINDSACTMTLEVYEATEETLSSATNVSDTTRSSIYLRMLGNMIADGWLDRTFALGVYITERYLALYPDISTNDHAILTTAAMHIASNLVDIPPLQGSEAVDWISNNKKDKEFTLQDLGELERHILFVVGIELYRSTTYDLAYDYAQTYPQEVRDNTSTLVLLSYVLGVGDFQRSEVIAICCVMLAASAAGVPVQHTKRIGKIYGATAIKEVLIAFYTGLATLLDGDMSPFMLLDLDERLSRGRNSVSQLLRKLPILLLRLPKIAMSLKEIGDQKVNAITEKLRALAMK